MSCISLYFIQAYVYVRVPFSQMCQRDISCRRVDNNNTLPHAHGTHWMIDSQRRVGGLDKHVVGGKEEKKRGGGMPMSGD